MVVREMSTKEIAFEVRNLTKVFRVRKLLGQTETVNALNGVSFCVPAGRTLGIVGESGSGKSTIGRCVLGLTETSGGEILLDGERVDMLRRRDVRSFRQRVQIVFQNPQRSFNPLLSLRSSVSEVLHLRPDWSRDQRRRRVEEVLDAVSIGEELRDRRPDELSGGQLQRIAVARAIAPEPRLIFLDEPTSSLDTSVRGEVLRLLNELQERLGITYVFVSHDLEVVRAVAHEIVVMHLGEIVEQAPTRSLFREAYHPYTRALLAASDLTGGRLSWGQRTENASLLGDGCRLRDRCPLSEAKCLEPQSLRSVNGNRSVRCWNVAQQTGILDAN